VVRPRKPIASLPDLSKRVAPEANSKVWSVDVRLDFALAVDSQPLRYASFQIVSDTPGMNSGVIA
jgi:hypothetical protein